MAKIVFSTRYGHYKFLVMSFDVTNALIVLLNLMNRVFKEYLDKFVIIFIDDIRGWSCYLFEVVLEILRQHKLCVKFLKCEFWLSSIAILRHVVSGDMMYVDYQNV